LSNMLTKARDVGFIRGLVPELVEGGLTHLQYTDDTIIYIKMYEESRAHTEFLLYYFESLFGLKINYHKSEVMVLVVLNEERAKIANMLNFREGVLPIKYLGIPISKTNL
jgi:hypothetical protein